MAGLALFLGCVLRVLHVSYPIGQYINMLVVSSKITDNGYARA